VSTHHLNLFVGSKVYGFCGVWHMCMKKCMTDKYVIMSGKIYSDILCVILRNVK